MVKAVGPVVAVARIAEPRLLRKADLVALAGVLAPVRVRVLVVARLRSAGRTEYTAGFACSGQPGGSADGFPLPWSAHSGTSYASVPDYTQRTASCGSE